jgi:hypothetical protein
MPEETGTKYPDTVKVFQDSSSAPYQQEVVTEENGLWTLPTYRYGMMTVGIGRRAQVTGITPSCPSLALFLSFLAFSSCNHFGFWV